MRSIAEFRKHAEECRALARTASSGEHREQLLHMAQTWDAVADERERELRIGTEIDAAAKRHS
jgi:hypothetical protein